MSLPQIKTDESAGNQVSFIVADYGQGPVEHFNGVTVVKSLSFRENPLAGAIKVWRAMKKVDADVYFFETASPGVPLGVLFSKCNGRRFVYRTASSRECDGKYLKEHRFLGKVFAASLRNLAQFLLAKREHF